MFPGDVEREVLILQDLGLTPLRKKPVKNYGKIYVSQIFYKGQRYLVLGLTQKPILLMLPIPVPGLREKKRVKL